MSILMLRFLFFNYTATTEIYTYRHTLSLHDALPISLALFPRVAFTNAYGLTETSSTISLLDPDDHRLAHRNEDDIISRRLGSVGKPLPTVEVEIRDDDGTPLGPNRLGEVYVRGSQVAGEYQGRSLLDSGGWFPTRDSGYIDEHGYLYLAGRNIGRAHV